MRVLVVDDHILIRTAVRAILSAADGIAVAGECSDGAEAVAAAALLDPQIVVMDVRMPIMDGLEATRRLVTADSTIRVLILTALVDARIVQQARAAGAHGCIPKDCDADALVNAVRTVARGATVWPARRGE